MNIENFIAKANTALIIIDMQEKFFYKLPQKYLVLNKQLNFIKKYRENIPIYIFELNPHQNGETLPIIKKTVYGLKKEIPFQKIEQNCLDSYLFRRKLEKEKIKQLIFLGSYTSFCVLDSAIKAKKLNYEVAISFSLISEPKEFPKIDKSKLEKRITQGLEWYQKNCLIF